MRFGLATTLLGLALAAACSLPSDLGNPCVMREPDGGILPPAASASDDQVISGTTQCENLVCIRPGNSTLDAGMGFCSNSPCTPDNGTLGTASQDCNSSSTGLVCNTLALDPNFVKTVDAEDGGAALLAEYLASTYCTSPPTGADAGSSN